MTDFVAFLHDAGLRPRGAPISDGRIHRVPVDGKRHGRDGAYWLTDDGTHGWVINWRDGGERIDWHAVRAMTARSQHDDVVRRRQDVQRDREARAQETQARYGWAALEGRRRWLEATPAFEHPYLARKSVAPVSIRQSADGRLLIPMRDTRNKIWSLQFIAADGNKLYLTGGRVQGCFHTIPSRSRDIRNIVCITEGYATGVSVASITGNKTLVAFDAGNLLPVALAYKAAHPDDRLIFAADNDHQREREGKPNVGLRKAAEAACETDGILVCPAFAPDDPGTDWNDVVVRDGWVRARKAFDAQLERVALAAES